MQWHHFWKFTHVKKILFILLGKKCCFFTFSYTTYLVVGEEKKHLNLYYLALQFYVGLLFPPIWSYLLLLCVFCYFLAFSLLLLLFGFLFQSYVFCKKYLYKCSVFVFFFNSSLIRYCLLLLCLVGLLPCWYWLLKKK